MLWQSPHKHAHAFNLVELIDTVLCNDIDHSRGQPRIRHHTHTFRARIRVQFFLFQHDFGVATKIREMYASLHRQLREPQVEVVRYRTLDGVTLRHRGQHCRLIAHIEHRWHQALRRQRSV